MFDTLTASGERDAAVSIVDSADTTARWVAQQLRTQALLLASDAVGEVAYLATDGVPRFKSVGSYFLAAPIDAVELVDL